MKKLTSITIILFLACNVFAQKSDSLIKKHFPYRYTTSEIGLVTGFGIKTFITGDSGSSGISFPALIISSHSKINNSNFTRDMNIGIQMGKTGKYTDPLTNIYETYSVTSITIGTGLSFNWINNSTNQIYSGIAAAWRITQIQGPDQYPYFQPYYSPSALQIDVLGFRGIKKRIGYNVVLGGGYKGFLRIGIIEKF